MGILRGGETPHDRIKGFLVRGGFTEIAKRLRTPTKANVRDWEKTAATIVKKSRERAVVSATEKKKADELVQSIAHGYYTLRIKQENPKTFEEFLKHHRAIFDGEIAPSSEHIEAGLLDYDEASRKHLFNTLLPKIKSMVT